MPIHCRDQGDPPNSAVAGSRARSHRDEQPAAAFFLARFGRSDPAD